MLLHAALSYLIVGELLMALFLVFSSQFQAYMRAQTLIDAVGGCLWCVLFWPRIFLPGRS